MNTNGEIKIKTEEIQEKYPDTKQGSRFLTAEERETIIGWDDEDRGKIWIYCSQQPMIRRLLKNPLFECQHKAYNKAYKIYPDPISVEGMLPKKSLTIRTKIRVLTHEEKVKAAEHLKIARECQTSCVQPENEKSKRLWEELVE